MKKIGWWRFLRVSLVMFRRKYYPTDDERISDLRNWRDWECDKDAGAGFFFDLLLGIPFTFGPPLLIVLKIIEPTRANIPIIVMCVVSGVLMLLFPVVAMIFVMIEIRKHPDKFSREIE